MHRIDADAHVANQFSDGDPGTGQPGTRVDAAWANAVQEALAIFMETAGLILVKGDNTQLADAVDAVIAAHAAVTSAHGAVSAPTASRIALRDAAGRAQFVAPAAAADAATKGYVDSAPFPTLSPIAPGANWTASATAGEEPRRWKDRSGVVHLRGEMVSTNGTQTGLAATGALPAGERPLALRRFPTVVYDGAAMYVTAGFLSVFPDGSMSFTNTAGFVLAASSRVALSGISFIAEQ